MTDEVDGNDPLQDLLVDGTAVDRRQIADAIKGRIAIDAKTGRLVLLPGYSALDYRRKILTVLLARKAALLLNLADAETLTNKQVADVTGLPSGSAAPGLKSLRELRLVDQDDSKAYFVPNARLPYATRFIAGEDRP